LHLLGHEARRGIKRVGSKGHTAIDPNPARFTAGELSVFFFYFILFFQMLCCMHISIAWLVSTETSEATF
jgi:hypothetical protein